MWISLSSHFGECSLRIEVYSAKRTYNLFEERRMVGEELRTILGNNIVRILYFFDEDEIIIATNGFVKKQQKTLRSEILLAK
jgi:toxin-antitoxin system, toxin component, relE family